MRSLVPALAITSLLFAGSTLYYWQKARQLQGSGASREAKVLAASGAPLGNDRAPESAPPGTARPSPGVGSAAKPDVAVTAAPAIPPAGARAGRPDVQREMMLPFAKDWLRQYDDATQRTSLVKAARTGIEAQYSRLRDRLKLDANTFGQLVDLLTQEQLEQQANYFRCAVDAACDTANMRPPRDHSDEYLAMLGADAFAQFNSYREAMPDWQAVVQLRGRLGEANYLKDGDAERLLSAMSAERERYTSEVKQSGAKLRGWGTATGMLWYTGDGGPEEQLASATQYSERMQQRAAAILDAEQLRAFVQLQEELLANFATFLRSQSGG
jgi:hypothetical protein